ncbi:DUF3558 domain-containing protein [Nocardia brasiliensis]|uniref:DUF3558 domain-containing protein n=1 Tax=Nocardia brasiliensis TaxID=37326 RepID=UPI002453F364|nr:DUF3558 domain-containing protein [Nocardia brasiliensis]
MFTSTSSSWLAGCTAAAAAATLAGCGGEEAQAQTAEFDPCRALTPQILAMHGWDAQPPDPRQPTVGAVTWKGCRYVARAGYGLVIETTNGTLAQVRQTFPRAVDISVGDRRALRYEARPDVPGGCTINVEMRSGSLYILADVPQTPTNIARGLEACASATDIAEKVVPLLPVGS